MPQDPIINLGLPFVQAYLRGLEERRLRESDAADREFRDRQLLFHQQEAQRQADQWGQEFGLRRQTFDLGRQNIEADNDRQAAEFGLRAQTADLARADEMGARRAYTQQALPSLAGGLATGQEQDPFGAMERVQAFAGAPSAVQAKLMEPTLKGRAREMVNQADAERAMRIIDQVKADPNLNADIKAATIEDLLRKAGGATAAHRTAGRMVGTPEDAASEVYRVNGVQPGERPEVDVAAQAAAARAKYGQLPTAGMLMPSQPRMPITALPENATYQQAMTAVQSARQAEANAEQDYQTILKYHAPEDPEAQVAFEAVRSAREMTNRAMEALSPAIGNRQRAYAGANSRQPVQKTAATAQGAGLDAFIDTLTPAELRQLLGGQP